MNNQVCDGHTIDHTPTVDVASGATALIGKLVGVALGSVAANSEGTFVTTGVFELPKVSVDDIGQGALVYLKSDNTMTTTASGNTLAGKAWAAAPNPSDTVWVKINA
jgi:predicted RecA/RadA family phage recombinase